MSTTIFSLICALIFLLLDGVDVSLTEAAVGAGISTILFLSCLRHMDFITKKNTKPLLSNLILFLFLAISLSYIISDLPEFGESKANNIDFRDKLAGQIEDETSYSDEARNRMVPFLAKYFGVYDQAYQGFTLKKYDKKPEYVLSALWINKQKKHEFNPPHDHCR